MSELTGIARFTFHEGQVEEFKRLAALCMDVVREQDTGTLAYETYFNADESQAIVIERYRDWQALLEHGQHVAHLMEPIIATGTVYGELLGDPGPELRAQFSADGPVQLFSPYMSL